MKLPSDTNIERICLSAILKNNEAADEAANFLSPSDFMDTEHSRIYEYCIAAQKLRLPINAFNVAKQITQTTEKCSLNYFLGLELEYFSGLDYDFYFSKLKNLSSLRRLMMGLHQSIIKSQDQGADYEKIMGDLYGMLIGIEKGTGRVLTPKEILENFIDGKNYLETIAERRDRFLKGLPTFNGLSTGYPMLDATIGGFQRGGLYYIGARTSMGKTTFLLNLIANMVKSCKVSIFSLEMDASMIMEKLLCIYADLKYSKFSIGNYTPEQYERIVSLKPFFDSASIWFDDEQGLTINRLVSRAHRLVKVYGAEIIFIDYLTLVRAAGKHPNKHMMVDEVSKGLQALAKQLKVPIVVLAQLNRASADESRPSLTSFRESGSIEEDADACLLLHRPEYYDPSSKPGLIECIVAKNRILGKLTTIEFNCNSEQSERYHELEPVDAVLRREKEKELKNEFDKHFPT